MIELNTVYNEDCLMGFSRIPDKSVNLIVIDPPYNIKKAEWDSWKTVDAYVSFMGKVFLECQRVLKDNGSFYFFHNDFLQIVELQNWINKNTDFVFKQLITLNKKNFKVYAWKNRGENCLDRNWFPNIEYCLFYTFQDETGLTMVKHDENNFSTLRQYFENFQKDTGLNKKQIIEVIGQRADHCFRWGSSQWDLPTLDTYLELLKLPSLTGFIRREYESLRREYESLRREYESLRREYESLRREYESLRYTFNKPLNISCVWEWEEVNSGKFHPTQKPFSVIEKIINTSSNEDDLVLDCFMGSGTTAIACINTSRNYIGFEKEEKYYQIIQDRIKKHTPQLKLIA
jgi:DNA modification methylase